MVPIYAMDVMDMDKGKGFWGDVTRLRMPSRRMSK